MISYFINKLGYSFLIVFGVVTTVFILFNLIPGDPARMLLGQRADEKSLEAIRKDLGLDKPRSVQYIKYINDLSPISIHNNTDKENFFYLNDKVYSYKRLANFGKKSLVIKKPYLRRSYQSKKMVGEIIREAIPNTFVLAFSAILIASVFGILLGVVAAIKKDSVLDRALLFLSTLGMSVPSFFAAILIGWFFAFVLHNFTGLNLTGNLFEVDDFGNGTYLELKNLILPAITLGIRPLTVIIQLTRNSMLDILSQDYIRTARAKGLSNSTIYLKHALKNALNPVITSISGWFASLLAGVVFVEYIFGWKGLGYVIVNALNNYDLPLIMGCVITFSIIFVVINFLVEVAYSILDPRVKLGRG